MRRLTGGLVCIALAGCASAVPPSATPDAGVFFDDFSEPDLAALAPAGWAVRERPGHPGNRGRIVGRRGRSRLLDDPAHPATGCCACAPAPTARHRARRMRSSATSASISRAPTPRACAFSDAPAQGPDGDVVVQTFYAVAPLKFDFDPEYSELDWSTCPTAAGRMRARGSNGVSWQTVRVEPWLAFNQPHEEFRSMDGWHVLLMQVAAARRGSSSTASCAPNTAGATTRRADGDQLQPVVLAGRFAGRHESDPASTSRTWNWVFHAATRCCPPAECRRGSRRFAAGTARADSVCRRIRRWPAVRLLMGCGAMRDRTRLASVVHCAPRGGRDAARQRPGTGATCSNRSNTRPGTA